MKRLLLLVGYVLAAGAADAAVEFSGVLKEGGGYRFFLNDGGSSSGWIPLGRTFKGNELVSFDSTRSVLTVREGEVVKELTLKASRVVAGVSPAETERQTQLKAAKRDLTEMLKRYTERHPNVIAQRQKIAALEKP